MPPDTGPDYVDQRIAELFQRVDAIFAEIAELRAIARGQQPPPAKRRLTLIQGGAAALIAVISGISALATRRPRHPVALAGVLTAAGTAALILAVPTYGAPPPNVPYAAPPVLAVPAPPTPTPAVSSTPGTPVPSAPASGVAPQVQPWSPSAVPAEPVGDGTLPAPGPSGSGSAFPSASAPAPSPSMPSVPAPSPSPSSCLITVIVPGVLDVCLL